MRSIVAIAAHQLLLRLERLESDQPEQQWEQSGERQLESGLAVVVVIGSGHRSRRQRKQQRLASRRQRLQRHGVSERDGPRVREQLRHAQAPAHAQHREHQDTARRLQVQEN